MDKVLSLLENIGNYLLLIRISDILDIAIIAFLVYNLLRMVKSTRAENILKGVVAFLLVLWLVDILQLNAISYLMRNLVQVGILSIIVLFQPEIRQILEKVGSRNIKLLRAFNDPKQQSELEAAIDQTVMACKEMSLSKTGVLIVFERDIHLDDMVRSGTTLDAAVSSELLKNIFFKNAPLHDGAALIEGDRIVAAKCILPVTQSDVPKSFGTRHRAAIGMSEISDAIIVVVSEETGDISIAQGGEIRLNIDPVRLQQTLQRYLTINTRKRSKKEVAE